MCLVCRPVDLVLCDSFLIPLEAELRLEESAVCIATGDQGCADNKVIAFHTHPGYGSQRQTQHVGEIRP